MTKDLKTATDECAAAGTAYFRMATVCHGLSGEACSRAVEASSQAMDVWIAGQLRMERQKIVTASTCP